MLLCLIGDWKLYVLTCTSEATKCTADSGFERVRVLGVEMVCM